MNDSLFLDNVNSEAVNSPLTASLFQIVLILRTVSNMKMGLKKWLGGVSGTAATFSVELVVLAVGAYLSYTHIGIPLSNANGTVIRSTVTSGLYSGILVTGALLFGADLSVRLAFYHPKRLKAMLSSGLAVAAACLPFLIYYNFYYSYLKVIGGTTFTVFPYGVQTGIPFMLALLFSYLALITMLSRRFSRKGRGIRIRFRSRRIRLSEEGREESSNNK
ncbi:hypothetical protein Thermo_01718 [Thermoplasmatales archaeon]|nr:hypothetical protein Thermo_01718 [Thermoplasmatales archaeon]